MNYLISNLRKLSAQFPHLLPSGFVDVSPLSPDVDELIIAAGTLRLRPEWIRDTIRTYRDSRPHHQAIVKEKHYIDFDGKRCGSPSPEEVAKSKKFLEDFSLYNCAKNVLEGTCPPEIRLRSVQILEIDAEVTRKRASGLARSPYLDRALRQRELWLMIQRVLHRFEGTPWRASAVATANFYFNITRGIIAQSSGDFTLARESFRAASNAAFETGTAETTFFPNFFRNKSAMASYGLIIDGMEYFASQNYFAASQSFDQWLQINFQCANRGDATYDGVLFNRELCKQISLISSKELPEWRRVEDILSNQSLNIFRASRALWDHAQPLVHHTFADEASSSPELAAKLEQISGHFALLGNGAPLLKNERSAGVEREILLPKPVDLYHLVSTTERYWPLVAGYMIRMSLMMRCDYERLLWEWGSEIALIDDSSYRTRSDIERMSDGALLEYVVAFMGRNHSRAIVARWSAACRRAWEAIKLKDAAVTRAAIYEFNASFRAIPHLVRVRGLYSQPSGEMQRSGSAVTFELERCWKHSPQTLILDSQRIIPTGTFAYMRPRWGMNPKERFHGAGEPILATRMPEWMDLFERWAGGLGPVPASKFLRWLDQIRPPYQIYALRLLSRLRYFSDEDVRAGWRNLFEKYIPAEAKIPQSIFVAAGPETKSATHHIYLMRQALGGLGESESGLDLVRGFAANRQQPEASESSGAVFVFDDFLGTGDQMSRYFQSMLAENPVLEKRKLFILALVGYEEAVSRLASQFKHLNCRVIVAHPIPEADRAFHSDGGIWETEEERRRVRRWAESLGRALVRGQAGMDTTRDALGWKGSEALVAFQYNTPNNTLPIFWSAGAVADVNWQPLFERFV